MTIQETIKILHDTQKWRRGAKMNMPHSPKEFGQAIDNAIRILRKVNRDEKTTNTK